MKQYTSPTCDIVGITTEETLTTGMSVVRIFDIDPTTTDNSGYLILNSSEVLTNTHLWKDEEEAW